MRSPAHLRSRRFLRSGQRPRRRNPFCYLMATAERAFTLKADDSPPRLSDSRRRDGCRELIASILRLAACEFPRFK